MMSSTFWSSEDSAEEDDFDGKLSQYFLNELLCHVLIILFHNLLYRFFQKWPID